MMKNNCIEISNSLVRARVDFLEDTDSKHYGCVVRDLVFNIEMAGIDYSFPISYPLKS